MNQHKAKAFTLIELLISISILAVITMAIIPSFGNFAFRNAVLVSAEGLKNDLELVQSKSVAGVAVLSDLVSWGAVFGSAGSSSYSLGYISSTTGWNVQKVVTLPGGVLVTCNVTQVSFERITGSLAGVGSCEFYLASDTNTKKIVAITSAGSITVN